MTVSHCVHDIILSHGLPLSLFLAGLVGGFTHCTAMCSPFVLAQTGACKNVRKIRSSLLAPYHLGRMTTYVFLAVLVSTIMNAGIVNSDLKSFVSAPLLVLAATIFLVHAFPRLAVFFPWARRTYTALPYKLLTRAATGLMQDTGTLSRYGLGVLLGFMPCGLVASALMASATAATPLQAALAMGTFTVGTIPALILVALGGNILGTKYPQASLKFSKGAMALSSLWLFILAGTLIL